MQSAGCFPREGRGIRGKRTAIRILVFFFTFRLFLDHALALTAGEIQKFQALLSQQSIGEKVAFWAEQFIGVPYDRDPLGEYVSKAVIVADERVDCMYLTFRVVELALSRSPDEAIQIALEKRFHSKGVLRDGRVVNYEDRFEYGEDMIFSGKWGREITGEIGTVVRMEGSRGKDSVGILSPEEFEKGFERLKSGDIVFFVKKPEERKRGEIVGHIGIVKVEQNREAYLIHASGTKDRGGSVKKVLLKPYVSQMPFAGVKITRIR